MEMKEQKIRNIEKERESPCEGEHKREKTEQKKSNKIL